MYLAAEGEELQFLGRGGAHRVPGAVLRRPRCLRAQQGRDGNGGVLERGTGHGRRPSRPGRRSCTARSKRRRSRRPIAASFTSRPRASKRPTGCATVARLIYNSGGRIFRMPVAGGTPQAIDTGFATRCNNDHGVSPDGTLAGDQRPVAGTAAVAHLHAADRRGERPGSSRRQARRTGTAGRPTARRWPFAASAAASSTSTPSPPAAATRRA